ncbi:hypothetical protein [Pseudomonas chlororaphis]|uniref:hypothetical protein n=1 Tax=Pseudomonas chlororaphis TaxID=587753 RepID=UPI0009BFADBF|nr:hypothetical protein [Pseudomonas chlororaphis]QIT23591.1 hypothetical protein HCN09_18275 [Pseudomonas chlororaphis subsp. aurantiaca]WDH01685.1 hypothetical protein PUP57_19400 [Pseudomonas chlororaphis]WDH09467.1 hypothetical protein PUP64_27610 [Pseudomonas chlororaphis]
MNWVMLADYGSIAAGAISASCWIVAAFVKVDPPESLKGKPDDEYWDGIVVNGADLIKTLRAQAQWNSAAAVAAAITAALQIAAKMA